MKFRRSSLFGLCVLSMLAVFGCNDPESDAKKCRKPSDCGNPDEWKCNKETNSCELRQPEHCINTIKDGDEADVNCGGSCLAKCEVGKACTDNDDCGTGNCTDKKVCAVKSCTNDTECVSPAVCWFDDTAETPKDGVCISCVDGIVNGDETDVDCGGNKCAQCEKGKTCKTAGDCVTGECTNKTCTGDAPVAPTASDLVINEVLPAAKKTSMFGNMEINQCDFVEIVNIGTHFVSLDTVKLVLQRIEENKEHSPVTFELHGGLRPLQAALVHACSDTSAFPADLHSIYDEKLDFTNSATDYTISLHIDDVEAVKVSYKIEKEESGVSLNLAEDMKPGNTALVRHNTLNENLHSPGMCANLQPFSTGCIDICANGVKDGDETDTDCGGSCKKCPNDKVCKTGADCMTGTCDGGKCVGEMPQTPVAGDLVINEVMPAADKSKSFDNFSSSEQCDFAEIVNKSSKLLTLDGISLVLTRTDTESKPVSYSLSGNLQSKGVALIHACSSEPFPKDVYSIYNKDFNFTNSGLNYTISLMQGETALATVTYATAKERKGESLNLPTDLSTDSTEMSYHSELSEFKHTPGRCLNNGTFASGCFDSCSTGVKDGDETDVDCGGSCAGCELEQACKSGSDCASNYCDENGTCAVAPCESNNDCGEGQTCTNKICVDKCANGIKDSDEADIDCGGSCATKCDANQSCNTGEDCLSDICDGNNKCTEPSPKATINDLAINEMLSSPDTSNKFDQHETLNQCEFIELVNISTQKLDLSSLTLYYSKEAEISDSGKHKRINLSGNVLSKAPILIHNCKIDENPAQAADFGVDNLVSISGLSTLTNTSNYIMWLEDNEGNASVKVLFNTQSTESKDPFSARLNPELNMLPTGEYVTTKSHKDDSRLHSPGLCANGNTFDMGCN